MALKPASEEPLDLDVDLSQVDTSMPTFPAGLMDLRVHDIAKEPNKEKNGFNLVVTFVTTEPVASIQKPDEKIPAGFPLKRWYALQHKVDGKSTDPDQWKKGLAELMDAALGTELGSRPAFSKGLLINKTVRAAVKVGEYNGRPSNEIGALTHPGN